jgi:predicted nucleic acid-binding protein
MKRYLLDTNVVSELRKRKPHGAVVAWLRQLREDQLLVSAVTLGELQAGVELTRQQDPAKAGEIEAWVDRVSESFQVVPMDAACFRERGRLAHGKSDDVIEDAMIAATARVHNVAVATRNVRHFKGLDVELLNPFTYTA